MFSAVVNLFGDSFLSKEQNITSFDYLQGKKKPLRMTSQRPQLEPEATALASVVFELSDLKITEEVNVLFNMLSFHHLCFCGKRARGVFLSARGR